MANRDDPRHDRVREILKEFAGRVVTSNFIFDETMTLCLYRLGHTAALQVGEVLRDPFVVDLIRTTPQDEAAAWEIFGARSDKRYSFTDCTSFAMMRRLGIKTAAALDDDFSREGFETLP